MEGVPQNSSMGQPEVQFYLERVSNLVIEMYVSEDFGPMEEALVP